MGEILMQETNKKPKIIMVGVGGAGAIFNIKFSHFISIHIKNVLYNKIYNRLKCNMLFYLIYSFFPLIYFYLPLTIFHNVSKLSILLYFSFKLSVLSLSKNLSAHSILISSIFLICKLDMLPFVSATK